MLPTVPSSEGRENFPEAVPVIAEIPLVLPSSEGRGKLGTTGTTVWFMVEYCLLRLTRVEVSVDLKDKGEGFPEGRLREQRTRDPLKGFFKGRRCWGLPQQLLATVGC